jgi:hypothetical protein
MVPMCRMYGEGVRERFYAEIVDGGGAEEPARPLPPVA